MYERQVIVIVLCLHGLQAFRGCDHPSWFAPYGTAHTADQEWYGVEPLTVQAPQDVIYDAYRATERHPDLIHFVSFPGHFLLTFGDTLHLDLFVNVHLPANGLDSSVFVRVSTDRSLRADVSNTINSALGLDDVLFPRLDAKALVIVTHHCLRNFMPNFVPTGSKRSTFQIIIAIDQYDTIYFIFNFEKLVLDQSGGVVVANAQTSEEYFLVEDPFSRRDPRSYTSVTNSNHNGQWIGAMRNGQLYIPALINPWSPWVCMICGGCGHRWHYKHGDRGEVELQVDFCPLENDPSPCVIGRHSREEWLEKGYKTSIRRDRRCCFDYRNNQPARLPRRCGALGGWVDGI